MSGAVYDSRIESTASILRNDSNRYLDHVVRNSTERIDCAVPFDYNIDAEIELGGETFQITYRERVWRNDPELTTGEIAAYLIRSEIPLRHKAAAGELGRIIMERLTRRFYISNLKRYDAATGHLLDTIAVFQGYTSREFKRLAIGSPKKYFFEGVLIERGTSLQVTGVRNPIENTSCELWFHKNRSIRQKVWSSTFSSFCMYIIICSGMEWRPELLERLRLQNPHVVSNQTLSRFWLRLRPRLRPLSSQILNLMTKLNSTLGTRS